MNPWIRWDAAEADPGWRWLAEAMAMPALLVTPARAMPDITLAPSRLSQTARDKFIALLGEEGLRQDKDARLSHAARATAADRLKLRAGLVDQVPDAVLGLRTCDEVLAALRICAEEGIAVAASSDRAHVALDLSRLDRLLSVDFPSGLAHVEAGIGAAELSRQLGARGLWLDTDSFPVLGAHAAQPGLAWLQDISVATPRGLIESAHGFPFHGAGIVISAHIRVHPLPARIEPQSYVFPDFAAGLAALQEAQRQHIALTGVVLSDAAQTRFNMQCAGQRQTFRQKLEDLYHQTHLPERTAAALSVHFCGSDEDIAAARKRFEALAARLGARTRPAPEPGDRSEALLDHGVTVDSIQTFVSWSRLPVLYAAARPALEQAMREQAPCAGAHGLVLGQVRGICAEGAQLRLTFLFPRALGNGVAQAESVRHATEQALAAPEPSLLETQIRAALRQVLDP